jgi:hypothetical protein
VEKNRHVGGDAKVRTGKRHAGGGFWPLAAAFAVVCGTGVLADPAPDVNLLPNPSFESVEPPVPTPETARTGAPADKWLPRTWDVFVPAGGQYRLPDDPLQAHSGRRCVQVVAPMGQGILRYGAMPLFDRQPWSVTAWAHGKGRLVLHAFDSAAGNVSLNRMAFPLTNVWTQFQMVFTAAEQSKTWTLDVTHEGPAEFWVDDVTVTHPGFKPQALPPDKPLGKDEHTLLYLPCEEVREETREKDIAFLKLDGIDLLSVGRVEQSKAGEGRFGRAMSLRPGSSLTCSASEYLNPTGGTIEVWIRLLGPRDDGISDNFVGVTGGDGMYFGKFIWGQIGLRFSNAWQGLCGIEAWPTPTSMWQPGVWRFFVACWDREALAIFVDGKLLAWQAHPKLPNYLADALCIGGSNWGVDRGNFDFDDLRISDVVRYRWPLPPNTVEKK